MASSELKDERSAPFFCCELEEHQAVPSDLLDPSQLCSSELVHQVLVEGALWPGVPLDPSVLQVNSASLSLAGEVDPKDRRVRPLLSWKEGEDHITWRPRLYVTQGRSVEELIELLDEFAYLSAV